MMAVAARRSYVHSTSPAEHYAQARRWRPLMALRLNLSHWTDAAGASTFVSRAMIWSWTRSMAIWRAHPQDVPSGERCDDADGPHRFAARRHWPHRALCIAAAWLP